MQKKSKKSITWIVVAVFVLLVAGSFFIPRKTEAPKEPGKLDGFAQCLKDKGAVFYGASWCSHCNAQKEEFGDSKKFLPYVECSTPDGKGQVQKCRDAKIEGYPTWVFPDNARLSGRLPLETLAQKTGCQLPQ
ncbi:MAG: cyclophilin type peptidylprolyl isomerase [uncultured bacterium]|nr:MAG: cyclophilin type peptidylprolyl isomerase [uncultured bacterium]